jgi:hypothetical protein
MKHLLSGVALSAVLAIAAPVWAQSPAAPPSATAPSTTSSTPPSSSAATSTPAPATSEKATATSEKATTPGATASRWVQPKPRRHTQRVRRYAHYGYYPYGYYRWGSPSDHMARQLNAQQLYGGGWGWGGGPYSRSHDSPN